MAGRPIAVVGGGLAGLCTAWSLRRRGAKVTVFDEHDSVAMVASYSNAGRFCPQRLAVSNYTSLSAIATTAKVLLLPKSASEQLNKTKVDAPTSTEFSWPLVKFGVWFLRNCTPARSKWNKEVLNELAGRAQADNAKICAAIGGLPSRADGSLWLHALPKQFDAYPAMIAAAGLPALEIYTAAQCAARFPKVGAFVGGSRAGCAVAGQDWSADAREFCLKLQARLQPHVDFRLGAGGRVHEVQEDGDGCTLATDRGTERFDKVVLCTGLQQLAGNLPMAAMRGYAVDLEGVQGAPELSVADYGSGAKNWQLTVFPASGRARLVGYAEFAQGLVSEEVAESRREALVAACKEVVPGMTWEHAKPARACLRPMSADGLPIVSPVRPGSRLWLNTGLGAAGWTLSATLGELCAQGLAQEMQSQRLLNALTASRFTARSFFAPTARYGQGLGGVVAEAGA